MLLLFAVLFTKADAQIRLKIVQEINNQPVSYAPVKWTLLNNRQVLQSQCDANGEILIYTQNSPVEVLISFLGYEILKDTFYADGSFTLALKQDLKYLPEAVVTDQYTAITPEKSIHKIVVIDAKKISAMAANNLNDVLSNQLNVKLGQDNILGSSLSMMGISGQNVKILLDGVPVIGRQNGNIDLSQINLNDVERIEIVEGPLSVAYGTNALAGAINIITKKKPAHKLDGNLQSYYESIGRYNLQFNLGMRKTNGIYQLSAGRNYFDGWSALNQERYQDWKPKEQYFGRFQYLRKIGLFDLNLKTEGFREKLTNKGLPRLPYKETAFDEYYYTTRIDNTIIATSKLPKNRYLNLIFAYNIYERVKNRYLLNRVSLEKTLVPDPNEQDTNRFSNLVLRGTYTKSLLNAKLNYQLGYDFNHETGNGRKLNGASQSITDFAGFLSMEITPRSGLQIKPGIRYALNSTYQTSPLPSFNVKYSQKNGIIWRASYARGFRAPDLKELFLYFVDINHNIIGNPNLKPEQSHNYQFSVARKWLRGKWLLQPEGSVFYNRISNRILLTNVQNLTYTYQNLAHFQSLNSNVSLQLTGSWFQTAIGYAYNLISTRSEGFDPEINNHEFNANCAYTLKKQNLTAAFFIKATGPSVTFVLDDLGSLSRGTLDGYTWMDFTLSKPFLHKMLQVSCGVKNIGNLTNLQTSGISGGVHSSGANTMLFATGRVYFVKLDYFLHRK